MAAVATSTVAVAAIAITAAIAAVAQLVDFLDIGKLWGQGSRIDPEMGTHCSVYTGTGLLRKIKTRRSDFWLRVFFRVFLLVTKTYFFKKTRFPKTRLNYFVV